MSKRIIMDEAGVKECVNSLIKSINEALPHDEELCIIGIRRRGAAIAKYIAQAVDLFNNAPPLIGELDVTLYRDDLETLESLPVFFSTSIPFDINSKNLLLVDDVIFTGRTCRAALDALFLLGRPARISFAALIDRGHRELPVQPDFTGTYIQTDYSEYISVKTPRFDGELSVTLWSSKNEYSQSPV